MILYEAGAGNYSTISEGEVTGAVKQLFGGQAPGLDEDRPKLLKGLDVVGVSLLTHYDTFSGDVGWCLWIGRL